MFVGTVLHYTNHTLWAREDSNLHGLLHWFLRPARLPLRHSPTLHTLSKNMYTNNFVLCFCPPTRDRTWDLTIKSRLLYQLSYGRIWYAEVYLNSSFKTSYFLAVPRMGLEPIRPCGHEILSLAWLPITPPRRL